MRAQKESIVIDLADPADAKGIVSVQQQAWEDTYPNEEHGISLSDIKSQTANFDPERVLKRLTNPDPTRLYLVARERGNVVGMALGIRGDESNTLQAMYISPEYQGRGIGSGLMGGVLEWFGRDKDILLGVVSYNEGAIGFYKKFGFVEHGERHDQVATLPSGKVIPEIEMVLKAKDKAG